MVIRINTLILIIILILGGCNFSDAQKENHNRPSTQTLMDSLVTANEVPGFNALFAYYPDSQIVVAIQFNCDYAGSKQFLNKYLDNLVGLYSKN